MRFMKIMIYFKCKKRDVVTTETFKHHNSIYLYLARYLGPPVHYVYNVLKGLKEIGMSPHLSNRPGFKMHTILELSSKFYYERRLIFMIIALKTCIVIP